jgi:hypothetical protein
MMGRGGPRDQTRKGREAFPWDDQPPVADVAARFRERDLREAMDDRTPAQRWLGDPPWWLSALGRREASRGVAQPFCSA